MEWPPADVPVLDQSALDSIREIQDAGAPDLIEETVALFLETIPPRIAALHEAVKAGDSPAIRSCGHAIKGSCWLVGLMRLGKACEVIEQGGAQGQLEHAPLWLDRIDEEYLRGAEALRRVAGGPGA